MKRLITLPSFNGVAVGQTATLDVPRTGTYHAIRLYYTESGSAAINESDTEGGIDKIRLKVNGTTQREFTPAQLFDINRYHGKAFANSCLPIFFSEPWARTAEGEDVLGWGMADVASFQIEVDILAGATSPGLSAKAVWEPIDRNMGAIEKWKRFTYSPAAGGTSNLSTLPKVNTYRAVHFFHTYLTSAKASVNSTPLWEDLTIAQQSELLADWGRAAQSGMYSIDFGMTNRVGDALPVVDAKGQAVADLRFDVTVSQADNITVLTRTIGPRD